MFHFQYTPYILPLLGATVISLGVAAYSWTRRAAVSAIALTVMSLTIAEWSLGYALEIAGVGMATKFFWGKSQYLGIAIAPLAWLIFAYNHAARGNYMSRRVMVLLAIVPAITIGLAFTTEYHRLIWSDYSIQYGVNFSALSVSHGFWFWVHSAYSYLCLISGTVIIVSRSIWRKQGKYRQQATILLIAVLAPWIGNVLYLTGNSPIPYLDITPFAFTVTILALGWGVFGFQLIDLPPIARSTVVQEMVDGMIVVDTRGRIADINPSAERMIGNPASKALGRDALDVLHAWSDLIDKYKDVLEVLDEISVEGEGVQRWYELRLSPLYDRRNNYLGRVITLRDVTEQHFLRDQLRRRNESLSDLHQFTLELLDRRDINDLLQSIVSRAAALLDAPQSEIALVEDGILNLQAATSNLSFLQGTRFGRDEALLSWQAFDTGKPVILDDYSSWSDRNSAYDGVSIHAVVEIPVMAEGVCVAVLSLGREKPGYLFTPEQVQTGVLFAQVVGLILDNANLYNSALTEIAERKHAEALLQESETRYRQIVESASDIIYRTDARGYFTYVNPTALHLMGFEDEREILGKHYLDLVAPEWRTKTGRFYQRQFLGGQATTYFEFQAKTAEGTDVWLGQNVQLIREEGRITGFQAVARDINAIKQSQEALAIARDQALDASRVKSQLLARVSHELRTPLSGILGYAELLRDGAFGPVSSKQQDTAGQIVASADYLSSMINELLDEAQIQAKSLVLQMEACSPRVALNRVQMSMQILARNRGLDLSTSVSHDFPEMLICDQRRLQQILINLVGNAIKFTSKGEIRVNLYKPDATQWAIDVIDTGMGIASEDQERIFEPFNKVQTSLTRENRGTGLGLAITRQLIELMGGTIRLKSEVGRGSTFSIFLPLKEVHDEEKSPARFAMVVEDDPTLGHIYETTLRDVGFDTEIDVEGNHILHRLETRLPDLIVLDLHMPFASGMSILQTLRADPRSAKIPVIVTTADLIQAKAIEADVEAVLIKPVSIQRLRQLARKYVSEHLSTENAA